MSAKNPVLMAKLIPNSHSNTFNDQPEMIELKYEVWEFKGGKALVNRTGWNGRAKRHWIPEEGLYHIKPIKKEEE